MSSNLAARGRRAGILGAGFISEFHVRALRSCPDAQLTAICDSDQSKAEHLQRVYGIPHCYGSLDEMLRAGNVDVVHVLVPPSLHAVTASQCLEGGCDVFLEKPMAASVAEARALHELAGRLGRVVGVNHNNTFHPMFTRLVEAVKQRRMGALQHLAVTLNVPLRQLDAGQHGHWMFRKPRNIILEQACHPLSQICRLLGPVRQAVSLAGGEMLLNTGNPFYSTWQCSLVCERGTAGLFLSFGREFLDYFVHAIGQDGVADLDIRRNTFRLSQKSRFVEPVDNFLDSVRSARAVFGDGVGNAIAYSLSFLKLRPASDVFTVGMRSSIAAFYRDLRAGRAPLEDSAAGLTVVEACEAVVEGRQSFARELGPEMKSSA